MTLPRIALLLSALALAACSSSPNVALDPAAKQLLPDTTQRITFIDTDAFDRQVGNAVGKSSLIDITLLSPASTNAMPGRLSAVLGNVQDAGGRITVKNPEGHATRSLGLLSLLPQLIEAARAAQQRMAYAAYDAEVTSRTATCCASSSRRTADPGAPETTRPGRRETPGRVLSGVARRCRGGHRCLIRSC